MIRPKTAAIVNNYFHKSAERLYEKFAQDFRKGPAIWTLKPPLVRCKRVYIPVMAIRPSSPGWQICAVAALAVVATGAFPAEPQTTEASSRQVLTNVAAVRELTPAQAAQRLPVRLRGVV